ncbi:ATP-binding cassette domain-containing protein [Chloroflexi bacterium TSY]|nr:ATP-binding cassette domain-containing protein [Chloroflexi bacterium TSY]
MNDTQTASAPLLEIKNLKKYFPVRTSFFSRQKGYVRAVDDVSLTIGYGETVGLVGESGCGKTTLGRCVVRLYEPGAGKILFRHQDQMNGQGEIVDLAKLQGNELRPVRRDIQMIFQDPFSSLNPRRTVFDTISEPLRANDLASGSALEDRVLYLMEVVGLQTRYLRRYPHAFSGGQRQRIGIARALATNPKLIVADEPVSALDVSIQAQILNLLKDLQKEFELSYLFVAHDLSVVQYISDRVAVMYVGRLVEMAPTQELFTTPQHPYTEALLSAVPKSEPGIERERIVLAGEIPNPANPPEGCTFHPRCPYVQDRCRTEIPALRTVTPGRTVACHFAEELELSGVATEGIQMV